jgi:hypothetical protein
MTETEVWILVGIFWFAVVFALAARCGLPDRDNPYRAESER